MKDVDPENSPKKKARTPDDALRSLMKLASKGEKSSGDALRLMKNWGLEQAESRRVLQELIERGFIDDRRYAECYVMEKTRLGGWGVHKIRHSLVLKGISREIIDDAMRRSDPEKIKTGLRKKLEKKALAIRATNVRDIKAKLVRYGAGMGYDYDEVVTEVENMLRESVNDQE